MLLLRAAVVFCLVAVAEPLGVPARSADNRTRTRGARSMQSPQGRLRGSLRGHPGRRNHSSLESLVVEDLNETSSNHTALPVFIHIPKTGGRRLTELLNAEYGAPIPGMYIPGVMDRFRRGTIQFSFTRFVYVHFDDRGVPELLEMLKEETAQRHLPGPRIVTMVRDPVQRIISEYYSYHDLTFHNPALMKQGCSPGSLEKYLLDPCSWDRQVRYLAGMGGQQSSGVPGATKALVHQVVKFLHDNNALIGSADCFEESIHRIGTELNWSSLPFYDPEVERVKKLFTRSANNVSFAEWRDGGAYIRELAHNATRFDRMLIDALQPLCLSNEIALTHWQRRKR